MDPIKDAIINFLEDLFVCKSNKYNDKALHGKLKRKVSTSNMPLKMLAPLISIDLENGSKEVLLKTLVLFNGKLQGKMIVPKDEEEYSIFHQHLIVLKTLAEIGEGTDADTSKLLDMLKNADINNNGSSATNNIGIDSTMSLVTDYLTNNQSQFNMDQLTKECFNLLPQLMSSSTATPDIQSLLAGSSQLNRLVSDIIGNTEIMNNVCSHGNIEEVSNDEH